MRRIGSPPRMRGKPSQAVLFFCKAGITPADAGKTPSCTTFAPLVQDHPRGCGENGVSSKRVKTSTGSPPRMRGKLEYRVEGETNLRITPADAGKTCWRKSVMQRFQDHPRGCGENWYSVAAYSRCRGSPPRMRGKLTPCTCAIRACRITPADAGKTIYFPVPLSSPWDHPRGCGENVKKKLLAPYTAGSPPRMRGKLHHRLPQPRPRRITPADAGKTGRMISLSSDSKDHPRGCGENLMVSPPPIQQYGSPPRMRGKPAYNRIKRYLTRITPADAGKTIIKCFSGGAN